MSRLVKHVCFGSCEFEIDAICLSGEPLIYIDTIDLDRITTGETVSSK